MNSSVPPQALAAVAPAVEARLAEVLGEEVARWGAVDPALAEPLEAVRSLTLRGGKRLRAAFCHWGFVGAGGDPEDPAVIDAGAAFELLHAFALVHDDVMDGSERRRGLATVHTAFASTHRLGGWGGEDRRFGEGVAILAGDLASVYADRLVAGAPPPARDIWHELAVEVNLGQYLDLLLTARGGFDLAAARKVTRLKSATYTVERPLQFGAALAGAGPEVLSALGAYGAPLGDAFQLHDDLLGVYGDPELTGKPVGDDLREGKPTPLLALAREMADESQLALLGKVGARELTDDDIPALQEVIEACGARRELSATIAQLRDEAVAAASRAPISTEAREALCSLADYVTARDR